MPRSKIGLLAVLVPLLASCAGGNPKYGLKEEDAAASEYQALNDEF